MFFSHLRFSLFCCILRLKFANDIEDLRLRPRIRATEIRLKVNDTALIADCTMTVWLPWASVLSPTVLCKTCTLDGAVKQHGCESIRWRFASSHNSSRRGKKKTFSHFSRWDTRSLERPGKHLFFARYGASRVRIAFQFKISFPTSTARHSLLEMLESPFVDWMLTTSVTTSV